MIFSILLFSAHSFAEDNSAFPDEPPQDFKIYQAQALASELAVRWENRGDVAFYEVAVYEGYTSKAICKLAVHGGLYTANLQECKIGSPGEYILHMTAMSNKGLLKDSYLEFQVPQ